MSARIDIGGQTFGRWTVESAAPARGRDAMWLCRCLCGARRPVVGKDLRSGHSVSCGCHRDDITRARSTTHGAASAGLRTPEYEAWKHMIRRCHAANDTSYPLYGARGIRVCDEWRDSFGAFLSHVGKRPSEAHSVDRIDVNGHYEPGNVRWATVVQQARNTRANRRITVNGETLILAEWAERTGIKRATIAYRIDRLGWNVERALSEAPPLRAAGVVE